jgi:hypothetical protein
LFVVCCLLFVVCCLLFVVCCLLFVVLLLSPGQLQGYDGDPALLGEVDQMLLALTKIEHFKEHMQCLTIKNNFQEQANVLMKVLNVCLSAVQQMKDSKRFKTMLTVVLKMGNFMNGGSRRGGAFGVKLDVLTKFETGNVSQKGRLFCVVLYPSLSLFLSLTLSLSLSHSLSLSLSFCAVCCS